MLSTPPLNHAVERRVESSSTRSHFTVQSMSAAAAAQKPVGSASEARVRLGPARQLLGDALVAAGAYRSSARSSIALLSGASARRDRQLATRRFEVDADRFGARFLRCRLPCLRFGCGPRSDLLRRRLLHRRALRSRLLRCRLARFRLRLLRRHRTPVQPPLVRPPGIVRKRRALAKASTTIGPRPIAQSAAPTSSVR